MPLRPTKSAFPQNRGEMEPKRNVTYEVAEITNGVYRANTVTTNYVQFWFRRFRSGIFDVKDAPHTGRPLIENIEKITEIIDIDRLVSSHSIAEGLKTDHKTFLTIKHFFDHKQHQAAHFCSESPEPL
ncbi:histone-lysine N-methyltransferase SETMAR [Trichonephila clavipes]|nr:histone-lysine N-methyltransferase SETMAR [Trichonephila clavipes]